MKDKLVQFVIDTVKSTHELHKRPTNGALLAEQIRAKFGSDAFRDAGVERLSDVIRIAVESGDISRNPNVKHLEVWPTNVPMSDSATIYTGAYYIRPDAWRAFAMQHDDQTVFFNNVTKEFVVRVGSAKDDELLVETPDAQEFKTWVSEYSEAFNLIVPPVLLESPNFLRDFSKWIADQPGANVSTWKKFRSTKVTQAIEAWGQKANVSTEQFLSPVKSRPKDAKLVAQAQEGADAFRAALIRCIKDMTETEIDSLDIPIRHVRNHFRPRY